MILECRTLCHFFSVDLDWSFCFFLLRKMVSSRLSSSHLFQESNGFLQDISPSIGLGRDFIDHSTIDRVKSTQSMIFFLNPKDHYN